MQGAKQTAQAIIRKDGVSGLYRGFGTVVFGAIPARIVSLFHFLLPLLYIAYYHGRRSNARIFASAILLRQIHNLIINIIA